MKVGPDFHRPDLDITQPQSFQHDSSYTGETDAISDCWWHVFNDPDLDQYVRKVLERNLDIQKATARVLEVQSYWVQAKADRFPSVNLQGQALKQHQAINLPVIASQGVSFQRKKTTTDLYSLTLPASFELDFWGRVARMEEAARADFLQAEESRRMVIQAILAETISLYLQIESLERRLQITEQSIDNYRQSLRAVEKRYERGLVSILDLYQARRVLAQAESSLPSLRQELGTFQQRLSVLLGQYPETTLPRLQPEDYYRRMTPVPPGLPSDLLLRRPDIRAAEEQLKSLNARVGLAKAGRFPRITLTGSFGYSSDDLDVLFTSQSELWNVAQGILYPLFNAGKVKANQQIAEARYAQGLTDYAKTVLTAFLEVENALLARKEQLERRERIMNLLKEARATQEIAQSRYERGLVNYLTVLDAQQSRFRAEENLVLVDLAILTNRVSLHRALGGGWDESALVEASNYTALTSTHNGKPQENHRIE